MNTLTKVMIFSFLLVFCLSVTATRQTIQNDAPLATTEKEGLDIEGPNMVEHMIFGYESHDPIHIDDDSDFSTEGFAGYGNSTHPYVLEGVEIEAEAHGVSIHISNTDAYFLIANCSFEAYYNSVGLVYLANVSNARIEDCFFDEGDFGLGYYESTNISVFNCTFEWHDTYGLWSGGSNNTSVMNSTFRYCDVGIEVQSDNETIVGNDFRSNDAGVHVLQSDNCSIIDNTFRLNDIGVDVDNSNNCTIVDNEFWWDGIKIYGGSLQNYIHTITSNSLNEKPILYVHGQAGISISGDYGQIIVANCSNAVIQDGELSLIGFGVQVFYSDFVELSNLTILLAYRGILMSHCNNASIDSCNVTACDMDGIALEEAANATITNCRLIENAHSGLQIYSTDGVNVTGNTLVGNLNFGISSNGENYTIIDNYFENNGLHEMNLVNCHNSTIRSNTVNGSVRSTVFIDGSGCVIQDNTLYFSSFEFDTDVIEKLRHTMAGNTLNGDPVLYHFNDADVLYDGVAVGQIILANSSTIYLHDMNFRNVSIAIICASCQDIFLKSINFEEVKIGLKSSLCYNMKMEDIVCNTTLPYSYDTIAMNLDHSALLLAVNINITGFEYGLLLDSPENVTIKDCSFIENNAGVDVDSGINITLQSSHFEMNERSFTGNAENSSVAENTFINNEYWGIMASSNFYNAWNITGNQVIGGGEFGIGLMEGFGYNVTHNDVTDCIYGIYVEEIENSTIAHNNLSYCEFGLHVGYMTHCVIFNNDVFWNQERGFYVGTSASNLFYGNSFGGNQMANAEDHGILNQWNNSLHVGNKWSDYSGIGVYPISGGAGSIDYYPEQLPDSDPPEISSPPDIEYEILSDSPIYITWEVSDLGLDAYQILKNGSVDYEHDIASWTIQYDVSGLLRGVYNFTILVNDTRGNEAWDSVFVSVAAAEGFIYITCDEDFETLGFLGSGTEEDPFRIENRTIVGDATCIYIEDTTAHFLIRNCTLLSSKKQAGSGIYMENVTHGRIENCTIRLKLAGIFLEQSSFHILHNNTITECAGGIAIRNSANVTITEGRIYDCQYNAVTTMGSVLTGGISLMNTDNVTIESNTLNNNSVAGISIYQPSNCVVRNNTMEMCGLLPLIYSFDVIIENNIVNGKPVCYMVNESKLQLIAHDYGQVILNNCSDMIIRDGELSHATVGILLIQCNNATIENVTLGFDSYMGLGAIGTNDLTIRNCTAFGCLYGTFLQMSQGSVSNCTMACNYQSGISILLSDFEIRDCNVFGNLVTGIDVTSDGIIYDNVLAWNRVQNAYNDHFFGSASYDDGISRGNYWSDYSGSGFYYFEDDGVDHYPQLITDETTPTIDHPTDTSYVIGRTTTSIIWTADDEWPGWFDIYVNGSLVRNGTWFASSIEYVPRFSSHGMYNVTVVAQDAAGNRITDTVFVNALLDDSTPPTIDHPADIQYVEGTGGHSITWTASDEYPSNWTLLHNGTPAQTGGWDGGAITVSIDGLPAGVHNMTIIVSDVNGNTVADSVLVTVTSSGITTPTTTTTTTTTPTTPPFWLPDTITLTIMISLGLLIVVIAAVALRRRGRNTTFTP